MKRLLISALLCLLTLEPAIASTKDKDSNRDKGSSKRQSLRARPAVTPSPIASPTMPQLAVNKRFQAVLERFRKGELQKKAAWDALRPFEGLLNDLSPENRLAYQQVRSQLLFLAGYPLLASEHAAKAIVLAPDPFAEHHQALWRILWTVSKVKPIQYILEELAGKLGPREGLPPEFGNNWNYILGNALIEQKKLPHAKAFYEKVVMQDRYFLPAQYQLAILSIQTNKIEEAESYLRAVLNPKAQDLSGLRRSELTEMNSYARMALGRLYYQSGRFLDSAREYRTIRRNSNLFYDALFEQSWALFMAGSLKHALGTLYAVNSPYFKDRFNPETKVLESMIYYWMCRYEEARDALADFSEQHREAIESLGGFLDRQRLTAETAYQLFENLITGVSAQAIGIPLSVLHTAAQQDVMLLARDQYATLIEETANLDTYGIYASSADVEQYKNLLATRAAAIRTDIGARFLGELRAMKEHFDELYSQSQFLYLELLMSQKEQILGRELHADDKATRVTDKDAFSGWSRKTQSWQDTKNEYWWDEIGFQVIDVDPECKL
jgi:tetratricopeptide (TPR) repeat protein